MEQQIIEIIVDENNQQLELFGDTYVSMQGVLF